MRVDSARRLKKKLQVSYAFQTNGILLDKNWTALFRNYHFLVGLSFDGTDRLHDRYRVGPNGEKTAARVQAAWDLLCAEKVDTNLLCVVTGPMAKNPEKVYRYLRRMGAGFWQFIPCMGTAVDEPVAVAVETPPSVKKTPNSSDPVGVPPMVRSIPHLDAPVDVPPIGGNVSHSDDSVDASSMVKNAPLRSLDWTLEPKDYAYFLKGMFDLWYQEWKRGHYVSIRNFDDYIHLLCGGNASACAACGDCGGYLAVEHDGSVYPCDFYVEDRWCLGNIYDSSMDELRYGDKMLEFLDETRQFHQNSHRCEACEFYRLCKGGCKHDAEPGFAGVKSALKESTNIFCDAFRDFFRYAMPRMVEIAQAEMRYLDNVK
ncbi:MAG: SPASM domain-containing protein [Lachnospiraceae bacterium]|nr:SPASM domain-containing protein [Lachnospiraceae bacterium]